MLFFNNTSVDPYYNLALEATLLERKTEEIIFILWQNDNTVVVGRNQNTYQEINQLNCFSDNVKVVRRISGGGAVYHDLGNLNFSFILNANDDEAKTYEVILKPIVKVLNNIGVSAIFSGKNDIIVNGQKVSGNAQHRQGNRLLHHGTLIFNMNLELIGKYLNVDELKINAKKIQSVTARVANIKDFVSPDITIEIFKELLVAEVSKTLEKIQLTESELRQIEILRNEKFITDKWNFQEKEAFDYSNKAYLENKGLIEANLNIQDSKIIKAKFYGDFLGSQGTAEIEDLLKGLEYKISTIQEVLNEEIIKKVFGENFTKSEIIELLFK
ncbi:lipoate protein ligase A [Spiroplasma sabaudiense Ar-1343]|uniref:lipoate--protein ligase n=1 Tax=Spiroplasma sabaudiense Ar-1343 TaxID=1276257 RepID=W6AIW8_9MOLU|nr:lipoate--protein ligase [Spiroplasma sabaudiense]AHI53654.1 lipoate protein ligase A [Spiroplasma sabaudiense Ar-1343]